MRRLLEASYRHAVSATDPGRLVRSHLPDERPAMVLAVGKAALPMVAEAREAYRDVAWLATPPAGSTNVGAERDAGRTGPHVLPGSHPLPDASSVRAAESALEAVSRLGADDLLLVLVSGGGSALWCAPSGLDLEAKRALTLALQRAGADIHELNVVRRHLSRIKGGRLAAATGARVLTLALSDVPGDDLADIASGPSVPDPTTFADALAVVRRFDVKAPSATEHLARGVAGAVAETPKPGGAVAARCSAKVIGSAGKLLSAAESFWTERGHAVVVLSDSLQGEASELARAHAELVLALRAGSDPRPAAARLLPEDGSRNRAVFDRLTG
ncbi:MAG TPA: DUF4147 domain-containing protein, partial [Trueperaceae bacterium]|nr:DUF4147 domain-containing protein [Trueperaceae bacterium]